MSSIEAKLKEAQAKAAEVLQQVLAAIQQSDWKFLQDKLQILASGRSETSLALLAIDFFLSRKIGGGLNGSVFGKILVALNGYNLLTLALKDKPAKVWKDMAGLSLQGPDAETIGSIALGMIGATGALGVAAGLAGPSEHLLSVLSLAASKLAIGFFLINRATNGGDAAAAVFAEATTMLEFGRHHARTGAVMLLYVVSVMWRGKSKAGTPKYITDMEKRLSDKLDQMVVVVKDQKSRIDAISPATSTPKKY